MTKTPQHNLPSEFELKNKFETDIATINFYDGFIIFEVKEGIVLSYETGFSDLLKILNTFNGMPWVYISNRVNSYSVNALHLKYLNHVPNLKAVGVVHYSKIMNEAFEGRFCTKPFKTFQNTLDAAIWAKTFL